jgi:hypothetical protein
MNEWKKIEALWTAKKDTPRISGKSHLSIPRRCSYSQRVFSTSVDRGILVVSPSLTKVLSNMYDGGHAVQPVVDLANDSNSTMSLGSCNKVLQILLHLPWVRTPISLGLIIILTWGFSSGGLGFINAKDPWPSKAGRKSALKHAEEQASKELSLGRQRLISGLIHEDYVCKHEGSWR